MGDTWKGETMGLRLETLGGLDSIEWGLRNKHVTVTEVYDGDEMPDPNSSDYFIVRTCDGGGALYDDVVGIERDRYGERSHALHIWEHSLPEWLEELL